MLSFAQKKKKFALVLEIRSVAELKFGTEKGLIAKVARHTQTPYRKVQEIISGYAIRMSSNRLEAMLRRLREE